MKYTKPPLTYEQQADQLLSRGIIADRELLISRLKNVSYYRLSGYWYPFRVPNSDKFFPNTTFETIWRRYRFDRRLRLILLDAIERVEIAVRTELVYRLVHVYGGFGYLKHSTLPGLSPDGHQDFLTQLRGEYEKSKESFVTHFHNKYGDEHDLLPLWMASELMTFGTLLTFFRGVETPIKQAIGRRFGVADRVMESWLRSLNAIRNVCAHHSRLWNRELGYRPMIPRKNRIWHIPVKVTDSRIFGILTILKYFMNDIAPQSQWPCRFRALLDEYPDIPIRHMGMPDNWADCSIWKERT